MEPALIECRALRKVFRTPRRGQGVLGVVKSFVARQWTEFTALDGVDLRVSKGEFVGLIGANGAGKTTLVKLLTGIVPATSGEARLFGVDSFSLLDRHKARLSLVMGQRSQLWWDIPAIDSFRLLREVYRIDGAQFEERVARYARRLDVHDRLDVQLRHLSLGQRMKMEIIGAFLHEPEIVFLDEPTIGLDLVSRETIRRFLAELNRERRVTIVLTSHDMEDIEALCERLVILERGRTIYDGDLLGLQRRVSGRRRVQVHLEPGATPPSQESLGLAAYGAELAETAPGSMSFHVSADRVRAFLTDVLARLPVRDLEIERQPLESLIKEIFERGARARDDGAEMQKLT